MKNDPSVWSTLAPTEFGLLNNLSDIVAKWEAENPGSLTPVGDGPILLLASDYGGQHREARFETFSFLVADWIYLWLWDEMRREVRRTILPERTIGYKNLNDGVRRKALAPFLRAANVIPGLLFTVALDKKTRPKIIHAESETMGDGRIWKASSAERLALIAGIATVLVAGLSDSRSPGQHILWVTDQDEIIPDKKRSRDALDILASFVHRWVPQNIGDVFWSIPTNKGANYQNEDILSLPDLVSGAIADLLTKSSFIFDGQGSERGGERTHASLCAKRKNRSHSRLV